MNGYTVTMKNSVNKSLYSKGFLAMIRDRFDVTVAAYQYEVKMNAKKISKNIKSASKYYKILTYDSFVLEDVKIEYHICKCMYVEMFEHYGIKPLCKIFCNTDRIMYSGLTRHVNFVRHSDLSDGNACFDEIFRK